MPLEPRNIANSDYALAIPSHRTGREQPPRQLSTGQHRWNAATLSNIDHPSHWSVPWADLMMVMMVMFAVMYATQLPPPKASPVSIHDSAPLTAALPPPKVFQPKADATAPAAMSTDEIFRLSEKLVRDANLGNIDVALTDDKAIKVSVHGNLFFDPGMAELKPDAVTFLDQLAGIIAGNHFKIEVSGHTDDVPISNPAYPTNWELSSARAAKVARYLIETGHLEPGRFTVIGHAAYQPTLPNTTTENKARNRRVEIVIKREEYRS
jgi:chemotaxis protein MotB